MREKHMFGGVNSPKGFYSRFNHIIQEVPGNKKIFIKGGPGMGKSTLMKQMARRAANEGLSCEVFHCSSDPASLDGIHIPELKTAIIDATPPHNFDPLYPCMGGELFDVSVYMEKKGSTDMMDALEFYTEQKKNSFSKGYHYLQAAEPLLRQIDSTYMRNADFRGIYSSAENLAKRILGSKDDDRKSSTRKLFISAITPEGFVNYTETVFGDTYCVSLKGKYGSSLFVRRFIEIAKMRGYSPVVFYCPMHPDEKPEHVYIPELEFSLVTYDFYTQQAADETIDLNDYIDCTAETDDCFNYAGILLKRAIDAFAEAKTAHEFLENIYVPSMNFEKLAEHAEVLIKSIF